MKVAIAVSFVLAALGCSSPSRLDTAAKVTPEGTPPASLDPDDRLARVERRLDKVIATLDQALGPAEPDPASTYAVPINEHDPIEGPRDAKVTIVEGYEFLCPYCYLVNPLVDKIRAKYPNDVRVVSKYMVIHGAPAATAGAYACAAAKQGKFVEMKTELWNRLWRTENGRPQAQQWLKSGQRELNAVGVNATPAFFVNGRPLRERSFEAFDRLVAEELAKANRVGMAGGEYYEREIVGKGLKQVKSRFAD
jgi:protein-disulfide isomerase